MPFWSKRSRAQRIVNAVPAYAGFEAAEIPLDEWRERWLPGLRADGLRLGRNWPGSRATGDEFDVDDVEGNLEALARRVRE